MTYYILDAFTNQLFGGNPAGVVLLESDQFPEEKLMLQIAAELRYSETAFIRRHSDKEFTIRYFTPKAEVELCGHATIASFYLLHHEGLASRTCLCHTLAGDLRVEAGERVMMQMAMPRIVTTVEKKEEIYKALGVNDYHPVMPVQIAYSGLPDLMIRGHFAGLESRHGGHRCHYQGIRSGQFPCLCLRQRWLYGTCPRLRTLI